jgi:branched-chain amino acid transport system substrate-binding protein
LLDANTDPSLTRPCWMWLRWVGITLMLLPLTALVQAELPATVKVGILNDVNGPFAARSGTGSVVAAHLAAEDLVATGSTFKVEILALDHLNKPNTGAQIICPRIDRDGVATVAEAVTSGVELAVNTTMAEKQRIFVATNVGTSNPTGKLCQPTTVR